MHRRLDDSVCSYRCNRLGKHSKLGRHGKLRGHNSDGNLSRDKTPAQ